MKKPCLSLLFILISSGLFAQSTIPTADVQVKAALMAAAENQRTTAKVYGYSESGEFIVLRDGAGEMVCIADDPNQKGFNASCYYKDLDAFMERGRQLRKEGKNFKEVFDIREEEVKSGKLKIPTGATLFVLYGPDEVFNAQTGEVTGANLRSVVYIPFATAESTGLPLKPPGPGLPWIMDPGTHRAHIMITPPAKENK